jgi:integral membrane sensor domain MASE1
MMSLVSALIGPACLAAGGIVPWDMFGKILFTWWMGDTTGVLVFTPILIAARSDLNLPRTLGRSAEAAGLLLIILLVSKGVFGGWWHFAGIQPIAYALTPFLLMIAFRSGATIALIGMILVSVLAILGTVNGMGPFSSNSTNDKLLLLQAFIGIISVTLLILSASLVERSQSNRDLKEANESLESRVADRTRDLEAKAAELNVKNAELETFMQAAVGREMRIIELKGQVNGLLAVVGKPPAFDMDALRHAG